MEAIYQPILEKLEGWGHELVLLLPNLVAAFLALVAAALIARVVAKIVHRLLERVSPHTALNELVSKMVRFVGLAIGFIIALQIMQLQKAATTFLAGAGLVGLALGFAFQDLSANLIAGVYIALRRPIEVGDIVRTNNYFGAVERVQLRTSLVRQTDGQLVRIPNRKIFENPLINLTDLGRRRVDVKVGVSYGEDLDRVLEVTRAALDDVDHIRERGVDVLFTGFGDSSIDLVARFWIVYHRQIDFMQAQSDGVLAIKRAYDREGITIPFPIRTLDFGIKGGEPLRQQLSSVERRL